MAHSQEYEDARLLAVLDELEEGDEVPNDVLELIQELIRDE